ncbi:MAG: hypothetical protein ABEH66_00080 [Halobacteriales archaeon]
MGTGGSAGRLGRWLRATWRALTSLAELLGEVLGLRADVDPHTRVTFRAVVDAVVPETPALGSDIGPEHGPGGLAVDLDDFVITYVDNGFQLGLPHVGSHGNLPLSDPVAQALDSAALTLLDRGENTAEPSDDRAYDLLDPDESVESSAIGPFARLSRRDRLRAIALLDEFEFKISPTEGDLFEFDAGLVGQLVVGFTEMIYYSEWEGYDEYDQAPSERVHPNDPAAVQSWRQTGYPGFANGYAALRGYLGTDDGPLGDGKTWTEFDGVGIARESGSFRENDYDTGGYEEPHPE